MVEETENKIFFDANFQQKIKAYLDDVFKKKIYSPESINELSQTYWNAALQAVACLTKSPPRINKPLIIPTKGWQEKFKQTRQAIWQPLFSINLNDVWEDKIILEKLKNVQLQWRDAIRSQMRDLARSIDQALLEYSSPDIRPKFLWLARGSLARGDVAPFSDIESACVFSKEFNDRDPCYWYFKIWWYCLDFEIKCLGESFDLKMGFHLDPGSTPFLPDSLLTPLTIPKTTHENDEPFLNQYICIYGEDTDLYYNFKKELSLIAKAQRKTQAENEFKILLKGNDARDYNSLENIVVTEAIQPEGIFVCLEKFLREREISIKLTLLGPLNWFIIAQAFLYEIYDLHPIDVITSLEEANIYTSGFWLTVKDVWGHLQYLRCYTQWEKQCDNDKISLLSEKEKKYWYQKPEYEGILLQLTSYLHPFYTAIHHALQHYFNKTNNTSNSDLNTFKENYNPIIGTLIEQLGTYTFQPTAEHIPQYEQILKNKWDEWKKAHEHIINPLLRFLSRGWKISHLANDIQNLKIETLTHAEQNLINNYFFVDTKNNNQTLYPLWKNTGFPYSLNKYFLKKRDISYFPSLELPQYTTTSIWKDEANLENTDLTECCAQGVSFDNSNLQGAILVKGNFNKASFKEAMLHKINAQSGFFIHANFHACKAKFANFSGALLQSANFKYADLMDVVWEGAILTGANFTNAKIDIQRFATAGNINGLILWGYEDKSAIEKLSRSFNPKPHIITNTEELKKALSQDNLCSYLNLNYMSFEKESFIKVKFFNVILAKTRFFSSYFQDVSFPHSKLSETHFNGTTLDTIDFNNNFIDQVKMINVECKNSQWKNSHLFKCDMIGNFNNNDFSNSYLSNIGFIGDFQNNVFKKIKLNRCKLGEANLDGSNFGSAKIFNSTIRLGKKTTFEGANIKSTHFVADNEKNLTKKQCEELDFSKAQLEFCDFRDLQIINSTFNNTTISSSEFDNIILKKSSFDHCTLENLTFSAKSEIYDCKFQNTSFKNELNLAKTKVTKIKFNQCDFENANFSEAQINKTNFSDCNLQKTYFEKAQIINTNFDHANLAGANFKNAKFSRIDFTKIKSLKGANFNNAIFSEVNLSHQIDGKTQFVDLTAASSLAGAVLPRDYLNQLKIYLPENFKNLIRRGILDPESAEYKLKLQSLEEIKNLTGEGSYTLTEVNLSTFQKFINNLSLTSPKTNRAIPPIDEIFADNLRNPNNNNNTSPNIILKSETVIAHDNKAEEIFVNSLPDTIKEDSPPLISKRKTVIEQDNKAEINNINMTPSLPLSNTVINSQDKVLSEITSNISQKSISLIQPPQLNFSNIYTLFATITTVWAVNLEKTSSPKYVYNITEQTGSGKKIVAAIWSPTVKLLASIAVNLNKIEANVASEIYIYSFKSGQIKRAAHIRPIRNLYWQTKNDLIILDEHCISHFNSDKCIFTLTFPYTIPIYNNFVNFSLRGIHYLMLLAQDNHFRYGTFLKNNFEGFEKLEIDADKILAYAVSPNGKNLAIIAHKQPYSSSSVIAHPVKTISFYSKNTANKFENIGFLSSKTKLPDQNKNLLDWDDTNKYCAVMKKNFIRLFFCKQNKPLQQFSAAELDLKKCVSSAEYLNSYQFIKLLNKNSLLLFTENSFIYMCVQEKPTACWQVVKSFN